MISDVDICNLALNHIAVTSISSLTENSNPARKCAINYQRAKEIVLRSLDWNFATCIESLALLDEEMPGWDYLYARPVQCLLIRKIYNDNTVGLETSIDTEYSYSEYKYLGEFKEILTSLNQRAIATNVEDAYLEYTKLITDPNLFDPTFVEALSYKLAEMLAQPLTGNTQLNNLMLQKFGASLTEAKRLNSVDRNVIKRNDSSYLSVRC